MAQKILAYVFLAAAALGTVWVVGGLATNTKNNLADGRSPFWTGQLDLVKLAAALVGIFLAVLIGRFLLGKSGSWLKSYGGFLACFGLFIGVVHSAFPVGLRIDIQAALSVQAYTAWLALAFFAVGGLLFVAARRK